VRLLEIDITLESEKTTVIDTFRNVFEKPRASQVYENFTA